MADDIVFEASLDDSEVLKALKNIDRNIQKLADNAEKDFRKVGDSAAKSGAKIGAMAGIMQRVTDAAINLGRSAINTFVQLGKASIKANADFETFRVQFETLLGSAEEADKRIAELEEFGLKTPFELPEIVEASRILEVFGGSVLSTGDNLRRIGDAAAATNNGFKEVAFWVGRMYDAIQSGRPFGEASMRLQEMGILSGKSRSEMERLQKAGADANEVFGVFSNVVDTQFNGAMDRLSGTLPGIISNLSDFQGKLLRGGGERFFESLKDDAQKLLDILSDPDVGESLDEMARAFGEAALQIKNLATSGLFEKLTPDFLDKMTKMAEDWAQVAASLEALKGILPSLEEFGVETSPEAEKLLDKGVLESLGDLWEKAFGDPFTESVIMADAWVRAQTAANAARANGEDAQAAFNAEIEKGEEKIREYEKASQEITEVIEDGATATDRARKAEAARLQGLADLYNAQTQAPVETDIIDPELLEEIQKALDKLNDIERDAQRDRIDIIRKAGQKARDLEEDFIQKRIDAARDYARKIDDIERKNAQAITDSATDLRRDEEDALRDFNRKRAEIEKDSAKERIKVEEDYRDEIRRINQNFEDSADEAARNRDAVTFFRLQRERDRQIEEAKITRTKRVDETRTEASEKREELNLSYQQQLEDARIADSRRLEDLQIRLQREFDEARLARERDLEDTRIAEDRKREELARSLERQLQEARTAFNRRVSDFKESLDAEIRAQVEAEQKKTQIVKEANQRRAELDRQYQSTRERFQQAGRTSRLGGRQAGGFVGAGQVVTVGERGPELFQPSVAGNVIPLGPGITSPLAATNIATTINNVTNASVNQSMLDPSQQSAMMRAIAANVAAETVRRIISG